MLADILILAAVLLGLVLPYLAMRKIWLAWTRSLDEPETYGDEGGMPAPADYSDEVTDEHFGRIAELVDQGNFENAEVVSGPAWVKFKRAG